MTIKIDHLHLKTPDPRKTANWWVENLGAKIADGPQGDSLRLNLDGVILNVSSFSQIQKRPQRYGLEHIAVRTDDFDEVVNKVKANGARILEETAGAGHAACFIETPDGVEVTILREHGPSGKRL